MKTPEITPYGANEKRKLLETARRMGELPYDKLDRLLIDAGASDRAMSSLLRSLDGVRIVDTVNPDILHVELTVGAPLGGRDDRDEFRAYGDSVRSVPRMTRSEEHQVARRLEFARERVRAILDETDLPDVLREQVLDRGVNCGALGDQLEELEIASERTLAALPCDSTDPMVHSIFEEYARLRRYFVERNLYLVVGMAAAYRTYGVPMMDLIQEGNASLIRAVEKFDWRKEVRFQTYAAFWVRQAIERLITANRGIVRVPNYIQQKMRRLRREGKLPRNQKDVDVRDVSTLFDTTVEAAARLMETDRAWYSLDVPLGGDDDDSYASMLEADDDDSMSASERRALGQRLDEVMSENLTPQERDIITMRFGLGGTPRRTLDQIGERMSVSRERIRQMQVKALGKLSKRRLLEELEDYL